MNEEFKKYREMAKTGEIYQLKEYFDPEKESKISNYGGYEHHKWFSDQVDRFIKKFNPKRVLDIGCAKGFMVEDFRKRGVEAWGIDISTYAINHAPESIRKYLICGDAADFVAFKEFDLIIAIETLEHIRRLDHALKNVFYALSNDGYFWVSVPFYAKGIKLTMEDVSHLHRHNMEWWINKIESHGFKFHPEIKAGVGEAIEMSDVVKKYGVNQANINELVFTK